MSLSQKALLGTTENPCICAKFDPNERYVAGVYSDRKKGYIKVYDLLRYDLIK